MLITSVQPDTKQMRIVRDAISKFHGEENFEEDYHYSWLPYTDSTNIGQNYPFVIVGIKSCSYICKENKNLLISTICKLTKKLESCYKTKSDYE